MEILQIVGLGLIAALVIAVLKSQKPEIAIQISILAGIAIFMFVAGKLFAVVEVLEGYIRKVQLDPIYLSTLIKIVGIAYIAEFGAEVCRDAGEASIASKIELAGKVIIVVLAVPIITSVLDFIIKIMP